MSPHSRRAFLKHTTQLTAAGMVVSSLPNSLWAHAGSPYNTESGVAIKRRCDAVPPIQDPNVKALALRALDAAKSAGAQYADVRLVHSRMRVFFAGVDDYEFLNVGVRALVNGYWGFASNPLWDPDEVVLLARAAAMQASSNAKGKKREVILSVTPPIVDQHWTMPVTTDPFLVHPDEIIDYIRALEMYTTRRAAAAGMDIGSGGIRSVEHFTRQDKAFASTEGTYCTQRCYRTNGSFDVPLKDVAKRREGAYSLTSLTPAGLGWEFYRDRPIRDDIDQLIAEANEDFRLPLIPIDVGRYDCVMDAWSAAHLTSATVGLATELDRALGYEANAGGTSYLNDPSTMLGTYTIGSPLLTVTGNRTDVGGAGTIRWDDEGVSPIPFPIVTKGVLSNYSTTREGAGWLKEATQARGCAVGGEDLYGGMHVPLGRTPNLVMTPGAEALDFGGAVAALDKGIAWTQMQFDMDFQQNGGLGTGKAYQIQKGKRTALLPGSGIMFQAAELWKSLSRIGGNDGVVRYGMSVSKGEPPQLAYHSVDAIPLSFKDISVVDVRRRA